MKLNVIVFILVIASCITLVAQKINPIVNHSQLQPTHKGILFRYIPSGKPVDTVACVISGIQCNPDTRKAASISIFGYVIEKKDAVGGAYSEKYLDDNKKPLADNIFVWFSQPYIIM